MPRHGVPPSCLILVRFSNQHDQGLGLATSLSLSLLTSVDLRRSQSSMNTDWGLPGIKEVIKLRDEWHFEPSGSLASPIHTSLTTITIQLD